MSRAMIILNGDYTRKKASQWVAGLPNGTRVTFQEPKRSADQNSKMWVLLSEIAAQVVWHGQKLSADDWKIVFLSALNREMRVVPAIEGEGFVSLGRSSSNLSKDEMSQLIELIHHFAAKQGVKLNELEAAQ